MNKLEAMQLAKYQYDYCILCGWNLRQRHVIQVVNDGNDGVGKGSYSLDNFVVICNACYQNRTERRGKKRILVGHPGTKKTNSF